MAATLGGTVEVIGGGKFSNGAVTGAFVYLLNHAAHKWHPTRESAANAIVDRLKVTGNEGTVQVFNDECGNEYFWEVPADVRDTYDGSYYPSQPPTELGDLKYVEQFHFSQGNIGTDGRFLAGSWEDWIIAQQDGIKVTHISLGIGAWTFTPGTLFNPAGSFRGLIDQSIRVWKAPTPYGTFPYGFKFWSNE